MTRAVAVVLLAGAAALLFAVPQRVQAQTVNTQLNIGLLTLLPEPVTTDPPGSFHHVQPADFDPAKTNLVQSAWLNGIGCPTDAFTATPNADFTGVSGTVPYTDTACPNGDLNDQHNEGLLLVKTGPTSNFAAATAELTNVKGITLTELGYDIRKSGGTGASALGSHCGAGAPRFDVVTSNGTVHFIGCNSPPAAVAGASTGWVRLRWDPATAFPPILPTDTVSRIVIVFDEGTDAGPDNFGAAILDNVDVNGTLVGEGPTTAN